jgi:hypothetical protein
VAQAEHCLSSQHLLNARARWILPRIRCTPPMLCSTGMLPHAVARLQRVVCASELSRFLIIIYCCRLTKETLVLGCDCEGGMSETRVEQLPGSRV